MDAIGCAVEVCAISFWPEDESATTPTLKEFIACENAHITIKFIIRMHTSAKHTR